MKGQGFFRQKARDKDAERAERPQAGVQANEETGRRTLLFSLFSSVSGVEATVWWARG